MPSIRSSQLEPLIVSNGHQAFAQNVGSSVHILVGRCLLWGHVQHWPNCRALNASRRAELITWAAKVATSAATHRNGKGARNLSASRRKTTSGDRQLCRAKSRYATMATGSMIAAPRFQLFGMSVPQVKIKTVHAIRNCCLVETSDVASFRDAITKNLVINIAEN